MDEYIMLAAVTISIVIGACAVGYVKLLKKRLKGSVLRYEKIEKYFKDEDEK